LANFLNFSKTSTFKRIF